MGLLNSEAEINPTLNVSIAEKPGVLSNMVVVLGIKGTGY